jgi:hypothetical protein
MSMTRAFWLLLAGFLASAGIGTIMDRGALPLGAEACPDTSNHPLHPVPISPDGGLEYDVTGVPPDTVVSLYFPPELVATLVLCGVPESQCDATFTATAGADSTARFFIAGGGCWDETEDATPGYLVRVYTGSELCGSVGVRSPDVVDAVGRFATGPDSLWCEHPPTGDSIAEVTANDAAVLGEHFKMGTYALFADLNDDGVVDILDASLAAPAIKHGANCGGTQP